MPINEVPVGTYADVTGVVNATAAAEIAVLLAELKSFLPDPDDKSGTPAKSPDYFHIVPSVSHKLRAELDALSASIAAAPTA